MLQFRPFVSISMEDVLIFNITYQEKDERMKSNPDLYFNSATVSLFFLLIYVCDYSQVPVFKTNITLSF